MSIESGKKTPRPPRPTGARNGVHTPPVHEVLETIVGIQSRVMAGEEPRTVFEHLLAQLLQVSSSEYGFIGEVLHDPDGTPYLRSHALVNIAWDEASRRLYQRHLRQGLEFRNLASLFGAVMVTGRPVLSKDPATDPRSAGLPPGHPSLRSFLGLPFLVAGEMVGMAGLANRPGGYDLGLVDSLEPVVDACAHICYSVQCRRQRHEALDALESAHERLRNILDGLADPVVVISDELRVIEANATATARFGPLEGELCHVRLHGSAEPCGRPDHPCPVEAVKTARGPVTVEHVHARLDGSPEVVEIIASPLTQEGRVVGVIECMRDITEHRQIQQMLRASEERYRHMATHDPLTGLPNRTLLYERIDHAVQLARRTGHLVAVLFLDLDGFKAVNDTLGHQRGDRLLERVARILSASLRESDTVARLGGDEFAVVLEGVSSVPAAVAMAEKIIAALARDYRIDRHQVAITASVGASFFPVHADTGDDLIRFADAAMYEAKRRGRNRVAVWQPPSA